MLIPNKSYFLHPQSICLSESIGQRTRIYAFTHILEGAIIGEDCNLNDYVFVEGNVIIGNRVTVKSGVQLWNGVVLEDDVFIGPNVTFTNDSFPRSRRWPNEFPKTTVRNGASIGANSTILPGITIGKNAMIGAGSVVTKDVPANSVVIGNPARIVRYLSDEVSSTRENQLRIADKSGDSSQIKFHKTASDLRGNLMVLELQSDLPFNPVRFFSVNNVPSTKVRGEHAHRVCDQYLVALNGSLKVLLDDGADRRTFYLDAPDYGLHIPPMIWSAQFGFSHDCVLGVFASHLYDDGDYIRSYENFLFEIQLQNKKDD